MAGHVFGESKGDRGFAAGRAKVLDRSNTAQHVREEDVKDRAKGQRPKNSNWHIALRISGFLRRSRDGIEADVSEEDDTGGAENPEDPAVGVSDALRRNIYRRRRNQGRMVCRIDESPSDADEEQDDAHLQEND